MNECEFNRKQIWYRERSSRNASSNSIGGQFEDRKYITEVIHNAFNQDCESRDVFRRGQEKIWSISQHQPAGGLTYTIRLSPLRQKEELGAPMGQGLLVYMPTSVDIIATWSRHVFGTLAKLLYPRVLIITATLTHFIPQTDPRYNVWC